MRLEIFLFWYFWYNISVLLMQVRLRLNLAGHLVFACLDIYQGGVGDSARMPSFKDYGRARTKIG